MQNARRYLITRSNRINLRNCFAFRFRFPQDQRNAIKSVSLTPENLKSITKLAVLIAWTSDELANHLLAETLEMLADAYSDALEGFLGAIYYPDRASVATRIGLGDTNGPSKFRRPVTGFVQKQILEYPDRTFHFWVEYIDRHGEFQQVG